MRKEFNHTYEELRAVALDVFRRAIEGQSRISQFAELEQAIGNELARREDRDEKGNFGGNFPLSPADSELFRELFWDLFRQGLVTLGLNRSNPEFPFFRLSQLGRKIVAGEPAYFFLDVSAYERVIRTEIPDIDETTLIYLKEAMQAFRSGCTLSATVMIGVAAEHTFLLLLELLEQSPTMRQVYAKAFKERSILQKLNVFRTVLDQNAKSLPRAIREDLDTHFLGIQSILRSFRNPSGHPTGELVSREQVFVLLQLFVPYCKKLYQLMGFFRDELSSSGNKSQCYASASLTESRRADPP